jgi:NDP-hexose C3-ketoreductase / dTDP-4-oxo-2-deoxy-alpha-D-pentos-2-ene 2,3-reductase
MDHVRLGRLALRVSPLCLGTMNFGPATDEADSHAIMDRALEHGINFFDTANVYGRHAGRGATERIVGRWFAKGEGRREKVVIATKVHGRMGGWPNERGLSARHIRRACDEIVSIPLLGRVSSLNVSVAAALLVYEARRRRGA